MPEQVRVSDKRVAEIIRSESTATGGNDRWRLEALPQEAIDLAREVQARRAAEGATGAAMRMAAEEIARNVAKGESPEYRAGWNSAIDVVRAAFKRGSALASAQPHAQDGGAGAGAEGAKRPRVVCLCGSTRFYTTFQEANYRETMAGRIVLSVGFYPHAQKEAHGESVGITPAQKEALDELHKRKIDLADEVLVLDVDGYIGSSTRSEINYAERTGKPIRYLSREPDARTTGGQR